MIITFKKYGKEGTFRFAKFLTKEEKAEAIKTLFPEEQEYYTPIAMDDCGNYLLSKADTDGSGGGIYFMDHELPPDCNKIWLAYSKEELFKKYEIHEVKFRKLVADFQRQPATIKPWSIDP